MKSLNAPDIQIHTHMLQEKGDSRAMGKLNWIQFNSFTSHFLLFIYSILYFCHCVGYNSNLQQLFDFVWYVSIVSFHLAVFRFFYFPNSLVRWELCFLQREKKDSIPINLNRLNTLTCLLFLIQFFISSWLFLFLHQKWSLLQK